MEGLPSFKILPDFVHAIAARGGEATESWSEQNQVGKNEATAWQESEAHGASWRNAPVCAGEALGAANDLWCHYLCSMPSSHANKSLEFGGVVDGTNEMDERTALGYLVYHFPRPRNAIRTSSFWCRPTAVKAWRSVHW